MKLEAAFGESERMKNSQKWGKNIFVASGILGVCENGSPRQNFSNWYKLTEFGDFTSDMKSALLTSISIEFQLGHLVYKLI